jgi:hypothetical protein
MKKNLSICILIILVLVSCATRSVIKLQPVPPSTQWYMGRNILTKTVNGITANIAFDIVNRKHVVYLVEIVNHSDKVVLVDPGKFYYTQYQILESTKNISSNISSEVLSNKFFAKNPEQAILEIEKEIAQENAQYAEGELADAAFGLLRFIGFIANIGERKTREEMKEDEKRREEERENEEWEDEHHVQKIEYLNRKLDTWRNTTMRITSLHPNQSMCGKVFFPKCLKKEFIVFHFPVGKSTLKFLYKRKLHYP